jgi:uncharacterized protein YjeT (DUF2065 family)
VTLTWDSLLGALALVFLIEGVFPLCWPARWKALFQEVSQLQDGQVRFFGLLAMVLGLLLGWAFWH